jgi:hypothetical protein
VLLSLCPHPSIGTTLEATSTGSAPLAVRTTIFSLRIAHHRL